MSVSLALLLLLLNHASGQYNYCDYNENVAPGQSITINSPNYPSNYSDGADCRWTVNTRPGYNLLMYCSDIRLPESPSCSRDRLIVSRSGSPQLGASETYCGQRTLTVLSTGQTISLSLRTDPINDKESGNILDVKLFGAPVVGVRQGLLPGSAFSRSSGGRFSCRVTTQREDSSACSCGLKGQNGANEYPMIAGIVDRAKSNIKCSAVVITNRQVLTAAHCVARQSVDNLAVLVGNHDGRIDDSNPNYYRIENYNVDPQYDMITSQDDIAIVRTKNAIAFSDFVGPACLPFKFVDNIFEGDTVTALSWNTRSFGGTGSNELMKVDVTVVSCGPQGLGPESGSLPASSAASGSQAAAEEAITRSICTSKPSTGNCRYAAGGPLLYTDQSTGRLYVVGIMNIGVGCAPPSSPDSHTRVTPYLGWVEANTPGANYCRT